MTQLHHKPFLNPLLWAQDFREVFLERMRRGYDHASTTAPIDLNARPCTDDAFREWLPNPALKGTL